MRIRGRGDFKGRSDSTNCGEMPTIRSYRLLTAYQRNRWRASSPNEVKFDMPMFAKYITLWFGAIGLLAAQNSPSVIGSGWGLDHLGVAVGDEIQARELFFSKLGFSVRSLGHIP